MSKIAGYYMVKLVVETEHAMMGAPVLHLTLGVDAASGVVNGGGEIVQALSPPDTNSPVAQVTGQIVHTGFGEDKMLVHLAGEYIYYWPGIKQGHTVEKFRAALAVDQDWSGVGTYSFGKQCVSECSVKKG